MKPIQFKEQNIIYSKDDPNYMQLPAHRVEGDPSGTVICCWQLTEEELKRVMETGVIWQSIATFNAPLQPQFLATESPFIYEADNEKDT